MKKIAVIVYLLLCTTISLQCMISEDDALAINQQLLPNDIVSTIALKAISSYEDIRDADQEHGQWRLVSKQYCASMDSLFMCQKLLDHFEYPQRTRGYAGYAISECMKFFKNSAYDAYKKAARRIYKLVNDYADQPEIPQKFSQELLQLWATYPTLVNYTKKVSNARYYLPSENYTIRLPNLTYSVAIESLLFVASRNPVMVDFLLTQGARPGKFKCSIDLAGKMVHDITDTSMYPVVDELMAAALRFKYNVATLASKYDSMQRMYVPHDMNNESFIEFLSEHDASVYNNTYICHNDTVKVIELLLEHGVNPYEQNNHGVSAALLLNSVPQGTIFTLPLSSDLRYKNSDRLVEQCKYHTQLEQENIDACVVDAIVTKFTDNQMDPNIQD